MSNAFRFWEWESPDEHNARELETFQNLASNFLNQRAADSIYETGSNLFQQAARSASDIGQGIGNAATDALGSAESALGNGASAIGNAASQAWQASAPAAWRPGTEQYQGFQQQRAKDAQLSADPNQFGGSVLGPINQGLSYVNQGISGLTDLAGGGVLGVAGRAVDEATGTPKIGDVVPGVRNIPVFGQSIAESKPFESIGPLLMPGGDESKAARGAGDLINRAEGAIQRVGSDAEGAAQRAARTPPPEGFAAPGELTQATREQLPNRDIFESAGWPVNETEGNLGYMPPGGKTPAAVERRMAVWQQIEPNPRIPPGLENPDMERFLDDLSRLRDGIVTGETKPESHVLGSLLAIASVNRGGTSYAKTLRTLTATTGRDAEELAARVQPDVYYQAGGTGQQAGVNIRPEIIWSMIAGDTTDPAMMQMLVGMARPDSFANPVDRQRAVAQGVEELYRRLRGGSSPIGGEKVAETIHGDFGNPQAILGYPTVREGKVVGGGSPWMETEPGRIDEMGSIARAIAGQAEEGSPYAGMSGEDLRQAAIERLIEKSPRGIGPTKTRFTASMTALPDYATLDTRMLRDVFGISPAASNILTLPEYELLSSKLRDLGSNTKYLYGQQWLPWEFLTGEKTTYNSLSGIYDNLNRFMGRAEQVAKQTGRPIGEVVGPLAEQEQRLQVELSDPAQVQARVGLAFRSLDASAEGATGREAAIRGLQPGVAGVGQVDKAFPELKKIADDAGLTIEGKPGIAVGGWKNDDGRYYLDKSFDLTVNGPKPAVRWFASAMMLGLPDEEAVMLSYRGAGANLVDHEGSMLVRNLTREQYEEYSQAISDAFPGWTMQLKARTVGGKKVYDATVVSSAISEYGGTAEQLADQMRKLSDVFASRGHAVKLGEINPVETEFIGRDKIMEVVRGGPRGARVVPREPEAAAGGTVVPDAPGGAGAASVPGAEAPGGAVAAADFVDQAGSGAAPELPHYTPEQSRRRIAQRGNPEIRGLADQFVRDKLGRPGMPETRYMANDAEKQRLTAQWYDQTPHSPDDPATQRAYKALVDGVMQQYEVLKNAGYRFTPFEGEDPYARLAKERGTTPSAEMRRDVLENKHLYVYNGENDPNSLMTPQENWIFRGVHDLFGHAANGYDFGQRGELNAAIEHAKMFPKEALPALFNETHGQNSFVNFGPNSHLPVSERPFAEQKGMAMPEEHWPPLEFPLGETQGTQPTNALVERAIERFGTTEDPSQAAYVLPDGRLVKQPGAGSSANHGEVGRLFDEKPWTGPTTGTKAVRAFLDQTGAMRWGMTPSADGRTIYAEVTGPITSQQRDLLLREARYADSVAFESPNGSKLYRMPQDRSPLAAAVRAQESPQPRPGDEGFGRAMLEKAKQADAHNPSLKPGQPFENAMSVGGGNEYAREVSAEDLLPGGGSATEVGKEDLLPGGGSARNVTPPNPVDQPTGTPAFSIRRYSGVDPSTLGPQRPPTTAPAGTAVRKVEDAIQWEPTKAPRGTVKEGVTGLIRHLFDNTVDVRHVAEQYQRVVGRPLSIDEDAWRLLRLSRGSEAAAEQFRQQNLAPAVKGLDDDGIANLNLILKANDAIDKQAVLDTKLDQKLVQRIAKKKGAPADPLLLKLSDQAPLIERARRMNVHNFSGLTADTARQALSELEAQLGPQKWGDLMQRAQTVWDAGHKLLQYKTETGLLDRATAADLIRDFPHYSPIRIVEWLDDQANGKGAGVGATLSVRGNGLLRLTAQGTDKKSVPPLDAMMDAVSKAYALGSKNEAAQQMITYFKEVPELAELIRPANKEALAYVESMRGDRLGKRVPGETTFSVFKDGQQLQFYVDKQLKQAFEIAGPNWLDSWPTLIAAPLKLSAELLRGGATGLNVLFMLPNAFGDAMTYLVRGGGVPSLPKNAYYLARGYKSSFLKDAAYQKMIGAGGGQSSFMSEVGHFKTGTVKGYAGRISTAEQLFGALKDLATFRPVQDLGQKFEEATRMAEFHRLTGAGKDARTAALGARDVTIDFARGGLLTKAVNGLVPFFNVGFQAPAQVVRALKDADTRGKALVGLMTMVVAPTIAAEVYNRQYGDLYKDVPQYVKDRGLVLMLPNQPTTPDPETGRPIPRYVTINLREWSPFAIAVREGVSHMLGDDARTWQDAAMAMLKNTSPIEPSQGVGGAVADMLPPIARTAIESETNHDFFRDRPIVPDALKNLPPEQQYTSQTSETAKLAGKALGKSPMMLEHGFTGLTAGLGQQALAASDLALKAAGVAETPDRGLARIEQQLAQTGLAPEKRAQLERERDRLAASRDNRKQLAREQPLVGGLLNAAGYREQGGQLETDAGKRNAEAIASAKATPLGTELDRLGVNLPDTKPQIEGVYLDRRRAELYRQRATAYRTQLATALISTPTYQQATDADKSRMVKAALSRAADWAAQTVVPGEVKGGREFLGSTIKGDIDTAIPTYLRAIEGDQELRALRPRRFLGVSPDDVDGIVADQALLSQYRSALGPTQGDMLFISKYGAKRYARLKATKVSPLYDIQVKGIRARYPEHTTIFSPGVDLGPSAMAQGA